MNVVFTLNDVMKTRLDLKNLHLFLFRVLRQDKMSFIVGN
jgi:hypothetical protein